MCAGFNKIELSSQIRIKKNLEKNIPSYLINKERAIIKKLSNL